MYKILKKTKFVKIVCFLLVCVFSVNIAGCRKENNGVSSNNPVKNKSIGIGRNIEGYTVYSQSTFDPMTKELLMGYLLNGTNFTLLVVPGEYNEEAETYNMRDNENILFTTAQAGVYKYDENSGRFVDPTKKLLLYYVTDVELRSWFDYFAEDDNFLSKVMDFASSDVDVEKPSRFKCQQLVNMGSGLNTNEFCNVTIKSTDIFGDASTGGMFLFFGYGSIEGYITYNNIVDYDGSEIANSLAKPTNTNVTYNAFDYEKILDTGTTYGYFIVDALQNDYEYRIEDIEKVKNGEKDIEDDDYDAEDIIRDTIYLYTELKINGAEKGFGKLKTTYELLGASLLTDYGYTGCTNIKTLKQVAETKYNQSSEMKEQEKWLAVYELAEMIDEEQDLKDAAAKEAFDIKASVALYSRYNKIIDYPAADMLNTGTIQTKVTKVDNVEKTQELIEGGTDNTYLLLVTAEGFVIDRGTSSDQVTLGGSDMLGFSSILAELVRMDACPNKTIAADMYNMLSNLKIYAGSALIISGVAALVVAKIGLTVASVISKAALMGLTAPVPGGRIVALVFAAIAGLVAIGAGLLTLFSGLKDKARLKGLGASDTNYCETYVATFNMLFETVSLTIPLYHYNIPKETDAGKNGDLSIKACIGKEFNYSSDKGNCVNNKGEEKEVSYIPLYYYANREQSEALNLDGCPMLMYFRNGKLSNYISGATTPSFIIEMLRVWGLLAIREIFYSASITNDRQKIDVYHTNNTNSRTYNIQEVRYCFNLEYEKDLYSIDNNYFCYNENGKGVKTKRIDANFIDQTFKEKHQSLISVNMPTSAITDKITESGGWTTLEWLYIEYDSAQFHSYKTRKEITSVIDDGFESHEYTLEISGIDDVIFQDSIINTLSNLKVKFKQGETYYDVNGNVITPSDGYEGYSQTLYMSSSNNLYMIVDKTLFKLDASNSADIKAIKVANFSNSDFSDFEITSRDENIEYELTDFFDYLSGEKEFNIESEEIAIYFTATIKETSQANYYYKNNGKKECDEGEYAYKHSKKDRYKCFTDDKVKSKYTPIGTSEDEANYYATSVEVGTITIMLDSQGRPTVTIKWIGDDNIE